MSLLKLSDMHCYPELFKTLPRSTVCVNAYLNPSYRTWIGCYLASSLVYSASNFRLTLNGVGRISENWLLVNWRVDDISVIRLAGKRNNRSIQARWRRVTYTKKIPTNMANWRDDKIQKLHSVVFSQHQNIKLQLYQAKYRNMIPVLILNTVCNCNLLFMEFCLQPFVNSSL